MDNGAFSFSFRPHRRTFDSLSAHAPGNLPSITKKKGKFPGIGPGGRGGGKAQLELTDALNNCQKQFINKSTHCVYGTTFIVTLLLFPLTGL